MTMPFVRALALASLVVFSGLGAARAQPAPAVVTQGDIVLREFHFQSGETLSNVKLHYRTVGRPVRDAQGVVTNAVLVLHGTGGTGGQFIRPEFSGRLFAPGGVLDASRYYLVMPDGIKTIAEANAWHKTNDAKWHEEIPPNKIGSVV